MWKILTTCEISVDVHTVTALVNSAAEDGILWMLHGWPEGCICQHQQKRSEAETEELPHQQDAGHGKDGPGEGQRVEGDSEKSSTCGLRVEAEAGRWCSNEESSP